MADPVLALVEIFKADAIIAPAVENRIFGVELPGEELSSMPRKCIIIRATGGLSSSLQGTLMQEDVEILCYGKTHLEAKDLQMLCRNVLQGIGRQTVANTFLHSVSNIGDIYQLNSDADFPYTIRDISVLYQEE